MTIIKLILAIIAWLLSPTAAVEPPPTTTTTTTVVEACEGFHTDGNRVDLWWELDPDGRYVAEDGRFYRYTDSPTDGCTYARCWQNDSPPPYEYGPVPCPWIATPPHTVP